jgi:uncharacterized protein (TIGR02118 family)
MARRGRIPGIKVMSLLVPRAEVTIEAFRHEWLDVHAAAATGIPNMRGFVLSEVIAERPMHGIASMPALSQIVGLSESWWESVAAREEARRSDAMRAWVAHGSSIIDRARSLTVTLRDHVFRTPGPGGLVKRVGLMRRSQGTTRADCIRYWLDVHAPMHEAVPNLHGFVVSEFVGEDGPPDIDGIVETWWESPEARRAALATPGGVAWNNDGRSYLDFAGSRGFITRERVLIPRPYD